MNDFRRLARFCNAVTRRFLDDRCLVRASALAYVSLLSMVPLLAVMFSVLKGLGVQRRLEPLLLSRLSLDQETSTAIVGYIDQTNVGTLGALGAATLLLSVIGVLGAIETSFNDIWRVTRHRSVWRKLTDYFSIVLLTPFLLLVAVTLTSSLQVQQVLDWGMRTQLFGGALLRVLELLPMVFNALALGVLYAVMPNRRPSLPALVLSACIAGAAWHGVQLVYVTLQIGVAQYNAIYGALSQLPITLVWLYVSWMVMLVGAEIAAVYEFGPEASHHGVPHEGAIALQVLVRAGEAFRTGGDLVDPLRVARQLGVPPDPVQHVCRALAEWGWLVALEGEPVRYVLGCDSSQLDLGRLTELEVGEVPKGCSDTVVGLLAAAAIDTREAWGRLRLPESKQAMASPGAATK